MGETLLVTGGAGFIGSNFVRHALAHGSDRVVVVDKLTYAGDELSLADVAADPRFDFVRADIADGAAMRELLERHRPDAVVNFAAETHVDRSIDGPRPFLQSNVVGVFELLESARRLQATRAPHERGAFRFLHVSTDEVYGSLGATGRFTEDTPYAPNSPYAATKASADHLVRAWHRTFGLPTLVTNCSNNYGPYQYPEKLIPLMILNALEGKALPIYGQGENVRDWLYVEDHCAGILAVLRRGRAGETYNLGGGAERTNLEVVETLCALLEAERPAAANPALRAAGKASYAALKEHVADRPGHDVRYAIDASKAAADLGWSPRHDFEAGLRRTVRWYLEHEAWCRHIQTKGDARRRVGLGQEPAS